MEVEALIIFADDGSKPLVDIAKLEAVPGMLAVLQSDTSSVLTVVEPAPAPAEEQDTDPEVSDTQTASSSSMLLPIVASAAVAVAVLAVGSALWMRCRTQRGEEGVQVSGEAVHASLYKGDKMEHVLASIVCTLEVDRDPAPRKRSLDGVTEEVHTV